MESLAEFVPSHNAQNGLCFTSTGELMNGTYICYLVQYSGLKQPETRGMAGLSFESVSLKHWVKVFHTNMYMYIYVVRVITLMLGT